MSRYIRNWTGYYDFGISSSTPPPSGPTMDFQLLASDATIGTGNIISAWDFFDTVNGSPVRMNNRIEFVENFAVETAQDLIDAEYGPYTLVLVLNVEGNADLYGSASAYELIVNQIQGVTFNGIQQRNIPATGNFVVFIGYDGTDSHLQVNDGTVSTVSGQQVGPGGNYTNLSSSPVAVHDHPVRIFEIRRYDDWLDSTARSNLKTTLLNTYPNLPTITDQMRWDFNRTITSGKVSQWGPFEQSDANNRPVVSGQNILFTGDSLDRTGFTLEPFTYYVVSRNDSLHNFVFQTTNNDEEMICGVQRNSRSMTHHFDSSAEGAIDNTAIPANGLIVTAFGSDGTEFFTKTYGSDYQSNTVLTNLTNPRNANLSSEGTTINIPEVRFNFGTMHTESQVDQHLVDLYECYASP